MKKVTMYELLGMVKGGIAPNKILINDKVYYLLVDEEHYVYSQSKDIGQWDFFIDRKINIQQNLNLEVLILDENYKVEILEEEKKIPEKLDKYADISGDLACDWSFGEKKLKDKINEIIDYLDYLKSKGE